MPAPICAYPGCSNDATHRCDDCGRVFCLEHIRQRKEYNSLRCDLDTAELRRSSVGPRRVGCYMMLAVFPLALIAGLIETITRSQSAITVMAIVIGLSFWGGLITWVVGQLRHEKLD